GTSSPVVISAITGGPTGCMDGTNTASSAARYEAAVAATGGITASICEPDWAGKLQRVGEAVFLARARFDLRGHAEPMSIDVLVNGSRATGWHYDATSNSVVFDASSVPPAGATVVVNYR